jgi:hypothetical protein
MGSATIRAMRSTGMMMAGVAMLAVVACSKKSTTNSAECPPGVTHGTINGLEDGGVATIAGDPVGSLSSAGSFSCALLVPVGAGSLIVFSNATQAFSVNYQIGAPSTQTVSSGDIGAVNVAWGQGYFDGAVFGGANAASCLTSSTPPGSLASDGTITWTGIPTGTSAAASFSLPALCGSNGNVIYSAVSGSFHIP